MLRLYPLTWSVLFCLYNGSFCDTWRLKSMSSNETHMHDEGGGNLVQDGNEPQVAQDVRDRRQTEPGK